MPRGKKKEEISEEIKEIKEEPKPKQKQKPKETEVDDEDLFEPTSGRDDITMVSDEDVSDVAKAINAILGSDDFRTKTELTKNEVRALAVLLEIGEKIKSRRLLDFAENFMACMISCNRGSRKEVVASFGAMEAYGKREGLGLGGLKLRE